jgi:ADP-ribose pyrophosphatase
MAIKGKKRGPWRVIATNVVYKDPWVTLLKDDVVRPDGKPGVHAIFKIGSGSSAIPLDAAGNVYLNWQYMYATGNQALVMAGGGKEKNESSLAAAKRELLEETGIQAKKWTALGDSIAFPSHLDAPVQIYLAENLIFQKRKEDKNEPLIVKKMPLTKALKLIDQGKITHAATMVALLKIARLKNIR